MGSANFNPPINDLLIVRHKMVFHLLSVALLLLGLNNFLVFHAIVEFVICLVGLILSVIAWNTFHFSRNIVLVHLATGFVWIVALELLHILAHKGMNLLSSETVPFPSSQIWVTARFEESLLYLVAFRFAHRFSSRQISLALGVLTGAALFLIFTGHFPSTFREPEGLTSFKIFSEYAIIAVFLSSIVALQPERSPLDPFQSRLLQLSILGAVLAEIFFTLYKSPSDLFGIVGHLVKLLSVWILFEAVVLDLLRRPFQNLAKGASTFESMPHPVVLVNQQGRILQANREAKRLARRGPEVIGASCHDLFHSLGDTFENCPVCRLIATDTYCSSMEVQTEPGQWRSFSIGGLSPDSDTFGLVHVIRDISIQKQAESSLEESIQLNEQIIRCVNEGIIVCGHDLRYKVWNPFMERLSGVKAHDILGNDVLEMFPFLEPTSVMGNIRSALAGEYPSPSEFSIEYPPASGTFLWIIDSCYPLLDCNGSIIGAISTVRDVTSQKKAEQALCSSQKRNNWLATIFSESQDLLSVVGRDFTFLAVNDQYERLLQKPREAIEGRCLKDFLGEEVFESVIQPRWQQVLAGETVRYQNPFVFPSGDRKWMDVILQPFREYEEEVSGIVVHARDITQAKSMEQILAETHEFIATLIVNAPIGVMAFQEDGFCVLCNPAASQSLGRDMTKILHRNWKKILPLYGHIDFVRHAETTLATKKSHYGEYSIVNFKNENVVLEMYLDVFESAAKPHLLVITRDVTSRIEAQEQLINSEDRLRTILESIHDGILEVNTEGRLVFCNRSAETMLGWSREELLQRKLHTLIHHSRPDGTPYASEECAILEMARSGQSGVGGKDYFWRKDGGYFPVEYSSMPRYHVGEPNGAVVTFRDISAHLKAEEERRLNNEQALQAAQMATVGLMSAGIAHEINNPNNTISLNANLLRGIWNDAQLILEEYYTEHGNYSLGGLPYSEMRHAIPGLVAAIMDNSRRIGHIVDNMKYLTRKGEGSRLDPLNLNHLAEHSVSLLQNQISKRTGRFTFTPFPGKLLILGNSQQLEQVFVNLILNALQSLKRTECGVFLSLHRDETTDEAVVLLQDEGSGIDPEVRPRIGEPFVSSRRNEGGMGLGLFLCRRILEHHKARMDFSSSDTHFGTTVTLRFPGLPNRSGESET
ncbi:MAG: PAS domain S-box protein [Magnetococcales bacterium]|nr:PAS domain S-box protein [Magnetococcales bacterium]